MTKNQILLLLFIILHSCKSNNLIDNISIIDEIDNLEFIKTIYEVSINDNENVIDTLSIEKIKADKNDIVRYRLMESRNEYGKTIKRSYYRGNKDLFFQKIDYNTRGTEFGTQYETFVNKKLIIYKGHIIKIDSINSDTIFMKFKYSYDWKGKKEALSITRIPDTINFLDFTKFNGNEKVVSGYLVIDNDTLEKRKMKYRNGDIIESIHEYKEPFKIDIFEFDNNKNVQTRKIFRRVDDSLIKSKEYIYENNHLGDLERISIKDFDTDTIMKRRFLTTYGNK